MTKDSLNRKSFLLTYFLLYLVTVVSDFQLNPLRAIHLDTIFLILFDSHNTEPSRVIDHQRKNCARVLLMRSCKAFEAQTCDRKKEIIML